MEAKRLHAADEPPLPQPDGGQLFGKPVRIPVESGPIGQLMDIRHGHTSAFSVPFAEIMAGIRRIGKVILRLPCGEQRLFTAYSGPALYQKLKR
jgi:hypothetical protein